jgi:UPF0042 nucleotide-binding protein
MSEPAPVASPVAVATGAPAPDIGTSEVVLVTGISGSGKSIALHALEDTGYFCVDNLPPELLREFVWLERQRATGRVAVAVDVRTAGSLPQLLPIVDQLRAEGQPIRVLFLDAATDVLVRRFSETRRPHPLAAADGELSRALTEALDFERELLAPVRENATVIDTSQLRPAQLTDWVRSLVSAPPAMLTLVFESFAYKHGVPLDADFVFDVRVLPNPFYVRELRPKTGRDAEVAQYLEAQPEVGEMVNQIEALLRHWIPALLATQRTYLTVCIGCTGGQHRSVYIAERLAARLRDGAATLVRHRELDGRD